MFDVDAFVADCVQAAHDTQPRLAVRDVLQRATDDPVAMARALPPERAGITRLHVAPELTVLQVVWAPGMSFGPHDHRMWAAIGIYTGGEDNTFYRRNDETLATAGQRQLRPGDVAVLGDDAIHSVANPTSEFTGSIHVYGGDFFAMERSEWRGDPYREQPYDVDYVVNYFEEANRAHRVD
jgi:predicted metal-dependent enzyme (double-stranded beta helix superfamily)